jgi:hypothetical protein
VEGWVRNINQERIGGFFLEWLALENKNRRLSVSECHILENTELQQ